MDNAFDQDRLNMFVVEAEADTEKTTGSSQYIVGLRENRAKGLPMQFSILSRTGSYNQRLKVIWYFTCQRYSSWSVCGTEKPIQRTVYFQDIGRSLKI